MQAQLVTGLKPLSSLVDSATVPMLYWNFAEDAVETINTTGTALPALTAGGTPTYANGALVLDDSSYYTYDTYDNAGLRAVFDLQEGVILMWARVNIDASATTGQCHMLSVHAGAGPQLRFNINVNTSNRPDIWMAFDGDTSGTQYAGASNEFADATDTNICLLVDNRVGVKALSRYVDGVSKTGSTWATKGAMTYDSGLTKAVRIGADSAGTAGNTYFGTLRRMGAVNFGTNLPSNITDIVQSLHQSNGIPTRELLEALQ